MPVYYFVATFPKTFEPTLILANPSLTMLSSRVASSEIIYFLIAMMSDQMNSSHSLAFDFEMERIAQHMQRRFVIAQDVVTQDCL